MDNLSSGERKAYLSVPGVGYHNDIWIANVENIYKPKKHVFGNHLPPYYNQTFHAMAKKWRGPKGLITGKVGDFVLENGIPKIVNIRTFTPGENKNYYESNEFGLDNNMMLITGNLEAGQSVEGSDIYWFNLETGEIIPNILMNVPIYHRMEAL